MTAFTAPKAAVLDWLKLLAAETEVYFPQALGNASFEFARVSANSDLRLEDWDSQTPRAEFRASANPVPPGKILSPPRETLFRYRKNADGGFEFTPVLATEERTLAGVRPCDLKAIGLMDKVNAQPPADPYYLTRRQHTAIVAHDCLQPCDEHCFCEASGSLYTRDGADVFLTPTEDGLLVECLTERGEALVTDAGFAPCDDPGALKAAAEAHRTQPFGRQFAAPLEQVFETVAEAWDSPAWGEHVSRCFSCGSCNLVCPTCYCFDVHDDIDLADPDAGERYRTADGCMLNDFGEVAGGHNFRPDGAARQRHRVKRKFQYLSKSLGEGSWCVGCGRCGHQCTVDIDIFDIVNDLLGEAGVGA